MNDELNGQLTAGWQIPAYAQGMLWLEDEANDPVQTEGAHGLFTLEIPAPLLTLRWGGAEGAALARLGWQADSLAWAGEVKVGGLVDSLHITELPGLDYSVAVLTIGGQPLKPDVQPYPDANQRGRVPYKPPEYDTGLSDVEETVTTWLVGEESPLLTVAQDALVSRLPVYAFGRLADDESGWGQHFALPILLQALTLFAA